MLGEGISIVLSAKFGKSQNLKRGYLEKVFFKGRTEVYVNKLEFSQRYENFLKVLI